ncbi:MAG: LysR family transcriptional regulator [Bacillota bacterium]
MEIRQLRYFSEVVKHRSFSKAAQELHISQPSLSNAIAKLEVEIGMQLIVRSTRNLELTESGDAFYRKTSAFLSKFHTFERDLEEIKQTGSGEIAVGIIESAKFWMPLTITTFKDEFPNIKFKFSEILGQEKVMHTLLNHEVHFTVTNQLIESEEICVSKIYLENLVLVLNKNDPLNRKDNILLHDLSDRDFIISAEGFQTRTDVLNAFRKEGVAPKIMYEIERLETACSLVEQGLGIAILPVSYLKYTSNPKITTHYIQNEFLSRPVYLAYLKDRNLSPAVYGLMKCIEEFFDR